MKSIRVFYVALILFLFSFKPNAQTKDTIYLWPEKVPNEISSKHKPVIKNNKKGNVLCLTDITNPALIVFEPEKQNISNTGIIICPGGGYNILAIDLEGHEIAKWFNSLGYSAFVLQYRVPQKQEGVLNDLQWAYA